MLRNACVGLVTFLSLLAQGCCTTYHRLARVNQSAVALSATSSRVFTVIERTLQLLDVSAKTEKLNEPDKTLFMIRDGRQSAVIGVDNQSLTIYVTWRASDMSDFPRRLETAIVKEFSDSLHGQLTFEDLPCDMMGP